MPSTRKTFQDVASKIQQAGIPVTLSPRELALGSGLGLTFIYEALRRGDLAGFRVGRRGWRIYASDARRWVKALGNTK